MTLEEAIKRYTDNAEYERTHGNLQGCLDFKQLAEWLKRLKRIEDYIADGKDDIECTYSLCFWEIEAVMNGEIWRSDDE